ncbi:MAG: hypothetical protein LLF76_14420 [Planctomycetaceae bacterium]|nr:hypothetical protein [Planctomycetaceae bacterium]
MLRQLLLILVLAAGMVLFVGCERKGASGTSGRGTTAGDQTQQSTTDEYNVQRGTRDTSKDTTKQPGRTMDGTTTDANSM